MSVLFVKQRSSVSEAPLGGLRGNARDLSSARWKARSLLPIGKAYTSEHTSKSAFAEGGHFEVKYYICRRVTFTANI